MGKIIKKYWVLFCTFFLINIFFISVVMNIFNYEKQLNTQNSLISEEAKTLFFQTADNVTTKDLINTIQDRNVTLEGNIMVNNDEEETEIIGVYYNYEIEKTYPLSEGRMFTLEEIENGEKVALVGYNLKDRIKNEVIKVQNEEYKVVGIVGDKSSNSLQDRVYINMNSNAASLGFKNITIDVAEGSVTYLSKKIYEELNKENKVAIEITEPIIEPLKEAIASNSTYLIMGLLACISLVFTVINISTYWIEKEKVIIGIKSLVGASKSIIFSNLLFEFQGVILMSIVSAYFAMAISGNVSLSDINVTFKSFILIALIDLVVSFISVIPTIIKINNLNINSIIKERT